MCSWLGLVEAGIHCLFFPKVVRLTLALDILLEHRNCHTKVNTVQCTAMPHLQKVIEPEGPHEECPPHGGLPVAPARDVPNLLQTLV